MLRVERYATSTSVSAIDIRDALETIDPAAAKAFTLLYWERRIIDEEE